MNHEEFERVFERQVTQSREALVTKAKEYASDEDRMHNFKKAAALSGGTPEKALWGFLVKHLVSLSDMVESEEFYLADTWDEKVGDSINYLILLRALAIDKHPSEIDPNPQFRRVVKDLKTGSFAGECVNQSFNPK